jgi:hypothetical protein
MGELVGRALQGIADNRALGGSQIVLVYFVKYIS